MKRGLRIAGSLVLVGLLAWRLDSSTILRALGEASWTWWAAAFVCYVVAQAISSVRWSMLARPLGFTASWRNCLGWYFAGNFFNLVLPTSVGGDVARAWYLARGTGRGAEAAVCVFADRLIGLYVLVALACVAVVFVSLPGWVVLMTAGAGLAGVVGLLLLGLASRGGSRLPVRLRGVARSLIVYRTNPKLLLAAAAWSLPVQVLNVVLVWCAASAMSAEIPLSWCFVLMPLVTLTTLAPVSVNGMGVREGAMVLLTAPLGTAAEQAVTVSLSWFSVFVAAGLVGAACVLTGRLSRGEVCCHAEPVGRDSDQGRAGQPSAAA